MISLLLNKLNRFQHIRDLLTAEILSETLPKTISVFGNVTENDAEINDQKIIYI
jgi:hypothetical protein